MAKGKNRKKFEAAGLLHEKAKLSKDQSAALESLTPAEVEATVSARNKLKGTFPQPAFGPIQNHAELLQTTKPGPIQNNNKLKQAVKPGPIQNNAKLVQAAKGPIQNNAKLVQAAKGPIQNNAKLKQAAKPGPIQNNKKLKQK